jgi:CysZ protein
VSGKIQTILQVKRKTQVSSGQYLVDCSRGMGIAFKHFFIDVLITLALVLIALLITWILPFLPFLILVVESYFFGYSMLDYRNEFIGLSPQESKQLINNYPGLVIGNGLFFNFFLLIPFIGVLFAPMLALIAAGKSINFMEKRKSLLCASDQSTLIMAKS